ncbi:hypothetical protein ASC65_15615 [Brevundimonas sp. Root1279]|nr:hypothetical protein ASC65_15615 [Brevundimonas sp. Root1279]
MEAFRARFRERCAVDLVALESLWRDGVRSGDDLRVLAHGLAGSGGTFGFPAVSKAAALVDDALTDGRQPSDADMIALLSVLRETIS